MSDESIEEKKEPKKLAEPVEVSQAREKALQAKMRTLYPKAREAEAKELAREKEESEKHTGTSVPPAS